MVGVTGLLRHLAALVEPYSAAKAASPLRGSVRTLSPHSFIKKPPGKAVYFGRPTGMALRTDSIFLKRENVPTTSDEDAITKLEFIL